jgi:hypothetical protein
MAGSFLAETNGPSFGAGSSWGQFRERRSGSYGAPFDAKITTLRWLALVNLDRNQK